MERADLQLLISAASPLVTGTVAALGVVVSSRNLGVASDGPWVAVLMKRIEELVATLAEERNIFLQLLRTPVQTAEEKRQERQRLAAAREGGLQRLQALIVMAPKAECLRSHKSSIDLVDDTFLHDDALCAMQETKERLAKEYEAKYLAYMAAIRRFAERRSNFRAEDGLIRRALKFVFWWRKWE